ncbi:hypothetical protein SPONN_1167 [uncultured Candidatus Thioglobus sp.]|nr:hypothetical protein SPONN_1167 [uncultured Candidatus Thioglobus sp.]
MACGNISIIDDPLPEETDTFIAELVFQEADGDVFTRFIAINITDNDG